MKRKYTLFLKLIGSFFALVLLAAPSLGTAAVTISQVRVVITNGNPSTSQEYCSDNVPGGCTNQIWTLGAGVALTPGQTLILTQTGNPGQLGGENFDTSERAGNTAEIGCHKATTDDPTNTPCRVQIFINGTLVYDNSDGVNNPLSAFNEEPFSNVSDPRSDTYQEDELWVEPPAFTGPAYQLELGYADNIHGGTCTSAGCFPQDNWCSFAGGAPTNTCPAAATWFVGAGIGHIGNCGQLGFGTGVMHPTTDNNNKDVGCYDAGALRITALPVPSLKVVKTPKTNTFTSGAQLTYTVVVSNNGEAGSIAHNVQLNDALPGNGGLVWATANPSQGTCNAIVSNNLHCDLGNIAAGGSVMVTITSTATTPAAACRDQPNPAAIATDAEGDSAQDSGFQTCTPVPGVTIIKFTNGADANDPNAAGVPNISVGGVVTWTYRVTNTGQTSIPRANVVVTDNTTGVNPTFTSEISGNGDTIFNPGEVWLYTATGTSLDLTLPPPAGVHTVANSCTAGGTQPPRTAYTNVGTVTIPGATANDPSSYCNPPPVTGKSITIGPSSMEGAIKIDNGDWVNGGYSFKTNFTGTISIAATVSITGPCSNGGTDTLVVPLGNVSYNAVAGSDWKPTGDQNSILSWEGSVMASGVCGGVGELNASHGAVFNATISGAPTGGKVTFRFKYRDPAAKGKPNTNCLNAADPNRNKADVCGASWSETKTDP
jgi:uncharacterized repeat protein (TIGR01451 family)